MANGQFINDKYIRDCENCMIRNCDDCNLPKAENKLTLPEARIKGEPVKLIPMSDKCTHCFANPQIVAQCTFCDGTGKEKS